MNTVSPRQRIAAALASVVVTLTILTGLATAAKPALAEPLVASVGITAPVR